MDKPIRPRGTKAGNKQKFQGTLGAGFSGDDRNMRGRKNVPCRILNDFAGDDKADTPTYQQGPRAGEFRRVAVRQTLSAMDFMNPENSGRFLPDTPTDPDCWERAGMAPVLAS